MIELSAIAQTRYHKITASATPFGTPNGSATAFQLVDARGRPITRNAVVTGMHRTDYQGRIVLSTLPRTNQIASSTNFMATSWTRGVGGTGTAPTITSNFATAPDGTSTASRAVFALGGGVTSAAQSYVQANNATVAGAAFTNSIWLISNTGASFVLQLSFAQEAPVSVTVTTSWQRFKATDPSALDAARSFRLGLRGGTGTSDSADIIIWGAQAETGSTMTAYIPTTTAAVTVTDYSNTTSGAVTLGQAPIVGATLDWDGTGVSVG